MAEFLKVYEQRGLSFPIQLLNGKAVLSSYTELIEKSIFHILNWTLGTRMFRVTFGSRLHELIGEQNGYIMRALVKRFLVEALSYNERRITLLEMNFTMPRVDTLVLHLKYKIRSTDLIKDLEITKILE